MQHSPRVTCMSPLPTPTPPPLPLRTGLTSRPFHGFHNIRVLECTGRGLDAGVDVMSMVLFALARDRVVASVYTLKGQCSTSEASFASCRVDAGGDSRGTTLRALVTDLLEGQTRAYGCNVTSFRSGGRVEAVTWSLLVRIPGKRSEQPGSDSDSEYFIISPAEKIQTV